jgi:hypothetical protein
MFICPGFAGILLSSSDGALDPPSGSLVIERRSARST